MSATADASGRLLVVGASGYLGRRIVALAAPGFDVIATHHSADPPFTKAGVQWRALDIRDPAAIDALITDVRPATVINCAYVQHGPDLDAITAQAPGVIASAAQRSDEARFVHLSSDVVFPGRDDRAYREDDDPAPVHDYGRAKLRAEQAVMANHHAPLIVRTSLIYAGAADRDRAIDDGPQEKMVRAALGGADFAFFDDEVRNPIAVDTLAAAIVELAASEHHGVLHVAGADAVDRLTFAQLLATSMGADPSRLKGRPRDPALGPRPGNLSLDSSKAQSIITTPLTGARATLSRPSPRSDRGW